MRLDKFQNLWRSYIRPSCLILVVLFNSCPSFAIEPPDTQIAGRVDLRRETADVIQNIDIERLVPGVENSINLLLTNGSKEDVNIVEIVASCGCVAAEPIDGKLPSGGEVVLKINLRATATSELTGREIKIVDDRQSCWRALISCKNIDLFNLDSEPLVFDNLSTPKRFQVRLQKNSSGMEQLRACCGDDACENLKIRSLGVIVESVELREDVNDFVLQIYANPRSTALLGESRELIEIYNSFFKTQIAISFKVPPLPKISPRTVSRYRLSEGVQRVMVFNIDPQQHNIAFRMKNHLGQHVDIDAYSSGGSNRVLLYNLSTTAELAKDCCKLEVYDKDNPSVSISELEVVE